MTASPAGPVLKSVRKDPVAVPQVKSMPVLVDLKSADLKDAAVTVTWAEGPPHPKQAVCSVLEKRAAIAAIATIVTRAITTLLERGVPGRLLTGSVVAVTITYWPPAGNKITAPLAKEIQPETFEPGSAVPADAVHVTSTSGPPALIVCTVDVAECVVPPNVRLQFEVV